MCYGYFCYGELVALSKACEEDLECEVVKLKDSEPSSTIVKSKAELAY